MAFSRFSSAVEQRFCKPKVGSSILSTGTSYHPRNQRRDNLRTVSAAISRACSAQSVGVSSLPGVVFNRLASLTISSSDGLRFARSMPEMNIRLQGKGLLRQVKRLSGRFTKRKCDDESVDD
jgi:hypothetical protein